MLRTVLRLVLPLAFLTLGACRSSCRELSELLCECQQTTSQKEICLRAVSNAQARYEPEEDAEAVCEPLVDECRKALALDSEQNNCQRLDTDESIKAACGLSTAPNQSTQP